MGEACVCGLLVHERKKKKAKDLCKTTFAHTQSLACLGSEV